MGAEILLELINTFDDDHIPFNEGFLVRPFDSMQSLKHRATIDLIKCCLIEGKNIFPISVIHTEGKQYQRLDGFCRYWAYKELGRTAIPCVFGKVKGEQSGLSPIMD